jgi:phospholipase D1/2
LEARKNKKNRMRRALWRLTALVVLAGLAYALWLYSPLREWTETERLAALLQDLGVSPWAGIVLLVVYVVGSFIVFPVTALIAATGVALGPVSGMIWATAGCLLAATINYCCARRVSTEALDNWTGGWLRKLGGRLEHGGIVSVMVARNIPVAPFTVVNVVAGAARIPFGDYMVGTLLGLGPTIAALTILGDRLRGAWDDPTASSIVLLALAIALWFAVAVGLQALSNRYASAQYISTMD